MAAHALTQAPLLHHVAANQQEVNAMSLVRSSLVGVACVAALVACKGQRIDRDGDRERTYDYKDQKSAGTDEGRVGTTTTTGADVNALSNESAIARIVAARCARETACNNVGSDKHFTNHDTCARELRNKIGDDLKASECPRGIDAKELDECMEEIRTESCNNPIDTISRLAACRTSDMCLKVDSKNR
jgi:hypothetical protein